MNSESLVTLVIYLVVKFSMALVILVITLGKIIAITLETLMISSVLSTYLASCSRRVQYPHLAGADVCAHCTCAVCCPSEWTPTPHPPPMSSGALDFPCADGRRMISAHRE